MENKGEGKLEDPEEGRNPSKKSDSKNITDENPPPPPAPVLPQEFKTLLDRENFAGEFLVKRWNVSEGHSSEQDYYHLRIPLKDLDHHGFLTKEQKQLQKWDLEVPLFVACLGRFTVHLRKTNQSTYCLSAWNRIQEMYELSEGILLELWAVRNAESSQLGFAIVILDETKLQELRSARQIPEEIRDWIMKFGEASEEEAEIVYVAKRNLVKNDLLYRRCLNIPQRNIENDDFLREAVIRQPLLDKITLIGPSCSGGVEVKVKTHAGLEISGAGWRKFANSNHLQEGMQVRLWFFRKPTSSSSAADSSLGFAVAHLSRN